MSQFDAGLTFGPAQAVGLGAFRMRESLQLVVESGIGVDFQAPDLRPGGSHVLAQFGYFAAGSSTGWVSNAAA